MQYFHVFCMFVAVCILILMLTCVISKRQRENEKTIHAIQVFILKNCYLKQVNISYKQKPGPLLKQTEKDLVIFLFKE